MPAASEWTQGISHVWMDVECKLRELYCPETFCICKNSSGQAHTLFSSVRRLMCSIALSRTDSLSCFSDGGMIERRVSMRFAILSLFLCICVRSTQNTWKADPKSSLYELFSSTHQHIASLRSCHILNPNFRLKPLLPAHLCILT